MTRFQFQIKLQSRINRLDRIMGGKLQITWLLSLVLKESPKCHCPGKYQDYFPLTHSVNEFPWCPSPVPTAARTEFQEAVRFLRNLTNPLKFKIFAVYCIIYMYVYTCKYSYIHIHRYIHTHKYMTHTSTFIEGYRVYFLTAYPVFFTNVWSKFSSQIVENYFYGSI